MTSMTDLYLRERSHDLMNQVKAGLFKNIIILSGAGVSTNAGIPDYRSADGQFSRFSPAAFENRLLYNLFHQEKADLLLGKIPTLSHQFAVELHRRGFLRRVYTQNVDGLYQKAGLPEDMIIEAHGNFEKETTVLYGETMPRRFWEQAVLDFLKCPIKPDLLLVMGTSLQTAPFCALPNFVPKTCVRALITLNLIEARTNCYNKKPGSQSVKFEKHSVSVKSKWGPKYRHRWPRQYLLDMDTDEFSQLLFV